METIRKCGSGFKQKEIFFSSSWIFSLEISKSEGVNRNKSERMSRVLARICNLGVQSVNLAYCMFTAVRRKPLLSRTRKV